MVLDPHDEFGGRKSGRSARAADLLAAAYVWQEGLGGVLRRDTVVITDDGPDVLTASPSWQ
jgi:hypothetical protein